MVREGFMRWIFCIVDLSTGQVLSQSNSRDRASVWVSLIRQIEEPRSGVHVVKIDHDLRSASHLGCRHHVQLRG